VQSRTVFDGDAIRDLVPEEQNGAKDLIEDFMIEANGVSARFLTGKKLPSLRRVVRTPKRWDRIVEEFDALVTGAGDKETWVRRLSLLGCPGECYRPVLRSRFSGDRSPRILISDTAAPLRVRTL
jgi:hypothetical protein